MQNMPSFICAECNYAMGESHVPETLKHIRTLCVAICAQRQNASSNPVQKRMLLRWCFMQTVNDYLYAGSTGRCCL